MEKENKDTLNEIIKIAIENEVPYFKMPKPNKFDEARQKANYDIIEQITMLVSKYPQMRFGQIIANYVFPDYREIDFFYEEPQETLKRLTS